MLYTNKDIYQDTNKILRNKSQDYSFPLQNHEKDELNAILEYIIKSVDDTLAKQYDLSPSVGLAAIQVGIQKRGFALHILDGDDNLVISQIFINPKIIAYSEQLTYIDGGEACLSVANEHKGIVPRYNYIKVRYYDLLGDEYIEEFTGFISVAFQHEYDHLNGILFYDHINKEYPFKVLHNTYPL